MNEYDLGFNIGMIQAAVVILRDAIPFYAGARCADYDEDCPTCRAWEAYDILGSMVYVTERSQIEERLLCNEEESENE